jgi:hypothetical protein
MAMYRIRMKTVTDDTGHDRQVCQCAIEIDAESAESALRPARALFCKLEEIADWSHRADCSETELVGGKDRPQTHAAKWPTPSS